LTLYQLFWAQALQSTIPDVSEVVYIYGLLEEIFAVLPLRLRKFHQVGLLKKSKLHDSQHQCRNLQSHLV
jgi:hypothetical protein